MQPNVLACSGAGCAGVPGVAEKSQEFAWRRVNAWLPEGMPAFWSAGVNCEPETTRRRSRSSWSSLLGQVLLGKSSAGFGRGLTTSPLSLLIQCAGRTRPQSHVSGFWVPWVLVAQSRPTLRICHRKCAMVRREVCVWEERGPPSTFLLGA